MKRKRAIIPIFISHLGCPNDCVFCNQKKISGTESYILPEQMRDIIEMHLETMDAEQVEIAFFGGSFTGIEIERQKAYLQVASEYVRSGVVESIRLSTRPDYIDDDILDNLREHHVKTIELGVQSFSEEVLKNAKRGHDVHAVYKAAKRIKDCGFDLGIQLMYGLPGDDFEKFFFSVRESIRLRADCVRLYPVLVIKSTELNELYRELKYVPSTLEETVEGLAKALKLYHQAGIPVIRIGLQRTDMIDLGREVVAGPFHPAIRELVYDDLFYEAIMRNWSTQKSEDIWVNPKQVSHLLGHKKRNLEKNSNLRKLILKQSGDIEMDTLRIGSEDVISIFE